MGDIRDIARQLGKLRNADSLDNDRALDLLKAIKKYDMTMAVLQETKVGLTVNKIKKHPDCSSEVNSLAKSLVAEWKELAGVAGPNKGNSAKKEVKKEGASAPPQERRDSVTQDSLSTGDKMRDSCTQMLLKALGEKDEPTDRDPLFLAIDIEACIFKEFNETNSKYKNKIRSRFLNLKDSKNPDLRRNVMNGTITPKRLSEMSSQDMASAELKKLREKLAKEAMDDAQIPVNNSGSTDQFQCGRCKGRNCDYYQLQTRSADEPMTTFVSCRDCGKRWKFC